MKFLSIHNWQKFDAEREALRQGAARLAKHGSPTYGAEASKSHADKVSANAKAVGTRAAHEEAARSYDHAAQRIHEAIAKAPPARSEHDTKRWVSDVTAQGVTHSDLLDAFRKGHVHLTRADLVLDKDKREKSRVNDHGMAEYHYVEMPFKAGEYTPPRK